jgi:hypothetical protein
VDTYIPRYDSYVPNYDRNGKRATNPLVDWTDSAPAGSAVTAVPVMIPKDLINFAPLTQEYLASINEDATNRPTGPVLTNPAANAPDPTPVI